MGPWGGGEGRPRSHFVTFGATFDDVLPGGIREDGIVGEFAPPESVAPMMDSLRGSFQLDAQPRVIFMLRRNAIRDLPFHSRFRYDRMGHWNSFTHVFQEVDFSVEGHDE